jgi:photosystem II stability/assembly factor-like uncharacterized protein
MKRLTRPPFAIYYEARGHCFKVLRCAWHSTPVGRLFFPFWKKGGRVLPVQPFRLQYADKMKYLSPFLSLVLLAAAFTPVASQGELHSSLTLTLPAGDYQLTSGADGCDYLSMDGFGTLGPEGAPALPTRTFLIALPPGARVTQVHFSPAEPITLPGTYRLASVPPTRTGADPGGSSSASPQVPASSPVREPYPAYVGRYRGQGQWRRYTYARVAFRPFQYIPGDGRLVHYPSLNVILDYTLPRPGSPTWVQVQNALADTVLDDLIATRLTNFADAQKWYPQPATPVQSRCDYVIIVPGNDQVNAVAPLKEWKERIGFSVKVETMTNIVASYTGDTAERVWNFLHDHYMAEDWGIRYVLLVGDVDQIPMRFLYPDAGNAYGTDYYYAKLSTADWDLDDDRRWGEFTDDNLDTTPDVIVGRIPFNTNATIQDIANAIVAFEQDIGGWKRDALLAHGTLDYDTVNSKTDTAIVAEQLTQNYFTPYGWTVTTLYEEGGISPSVYTPTLPLSQVNYTASLGGGQYGVVNLLAHGNPGNMGSFTWPADINGNGHWDPGPPLSEIGTTAFSHWNQVAANPANGIVFLCGCSTAAVIGDDPNFAKSPLRSEYLITTPRNNIMVKEYLEHGAPAVIGSTAGSDYSGLWSSTANGGEQSLNYYFYEHLVGDDARVGDAFYAAMLDYADRHGLARGIRVFNYFGDPSLVLKGIDNRPGGADTLIKEGGYYAYAADNANNGDMYVGVLTTGIYDVPANIDVFHSTDHGQSWSKWTFVVESDEAIYDLDVLVGDFQQEAVHDNRIHIAYTTSGGRVMDMRINPANPDVRDQVEIADVGVYAKNVSLARDPGAMPSTFNVYIAWEYEESGDYRVRAARSTDNGANWTTTLTAPDRLMPHIDAGPGGHVYVAMLERNEGMDVHLKRSTDSGQTWPTDTTLTGSDGALMHTSPVVGASTDPARPTVWVVYAYEYQSSAWGQSRDLRFAYSADGGGTWTKHRILSADDGVDEWLPDIAGYRTAPNQWMNLAYNYDPFSTTGYPRKVIWRWASGSVPANWSPQRIINDYAAAAPYADPPAVVYSPGVPLTGSGVVYGGANRNNLYFSAPWLTTTALKASDGFASDSPPELTRLSRQTSALFPQSLKRPGMASASAPPLVWSEAGDLAGAFAVSDLETAPDGSLVAAGVVAGEMGNEGAVFSSPDGGMTWERLGALPDAWSLSSLLLSAGGDWLAGGVLLEDDQPVGAVYRSPDGGATWNQVFALPAGIVYDLLETEPGNVYAATGPGGGVFKSDDGGSEWYPLPQSGEGTHVHALLRSSSGDLYAALETPEGGRLLRSVNAGESWEEVGDLTGTRALYALAEAGEWLYAAGKDADSGRVYRVGLDGDSLTLLPALDPLVKAITSLAAGPGGTVFAGADVGAGPSATRVYRLESPDTWTSFRGELDLASAVYDLESGLNRLYAATGYIYGNVYEVTLGLDHVAYLPLVLR